jgi:phenylacetate-CoA ligase
MTNAEPARGVAPANTMGMEAIQPELARLRANDSRTRAELLGAQRERLGETLRTAVATSPFYRDTLGRAVREGASLQDLPVLTKTTLMREWNRIVADSRLRLADAEASLAGERAGELLLDEYRAFATGGTTGERAVAVYDRRAWLPTVANLFRWVGVVGGTLDMKIVGIGAPTSLHITNRAFAEVGSRPGTPRLSVLTPLPQVVESLNAFQPDAIITYPSFVRRLVEEQDAGRLSIRPQMLVTTAEVLDRVVRDLARRTWGIRIRDSYGTTEAGLLGTECEAVAGMHIAEDLLVFEVLDEQDRPVPEGRQGSKVVVTTLFNRGFPLIRYQITDLVTFTSEPCACRRPFGRVTSIVGRSEDYLPLPAIDGGRVRVHAGRLRGPLAGVPGLRQFQLVPEGDGLRLRVSVRNGVSAKEVGSMAVATVREALRGAGASAAVDAEIVDVIERAGTGAKERLVAVPSGR